MAIILGQEAICPDGLGRVVAYKRKRPPTPLRQYAWIQIETYVDSKNHQWAEHTVELIDPRK